MKKETVNELYDIINNLKKENKDLKENQKKLEEKLNLILNDIKSWKEYKENQKIKNLNSLVIGDNEIYNMNLKNWINPNMKIKAELLYRLSRDGNEFQTFHNLCDNKGITLLLVKLDDGNIIGGYSTKDWDNSSGWKQDNNAFVFSLTENVKCITNSNNNYNSIYCNNSCGPYFNSIQFCEEKMNEPYICKSSYYNDSSKLYPGKKEDFYKAQEVEVYKIIIN